MRSDDETVVEGETEPFVEELGELDSVVIQRLIAEVRTGEPEFTGGLYDRVHNRHNR